MLPLIVWSSMTLQLLTILIILSLHCPMYLAGEIDYRSMVLRMCWGSSLSSGRVYLLQRKVCLGFESFISRRPCWDNPHRILIIFTGLGFDITVPKCPQIPVVFPSILSNYLPYPLVPLLKCPDSTCKIYSLFSSQGD